MGERGDGPAEELLAPAVLRTLFAHVPSALAVFSTAGRCVLVNPAYRKLFGAVPPPEYNLLRDENAARLGMVPLLAHALAGETVTTGRFWYDPRELEHVAVRSANRVGLECTFFPLPATHGVVEYVGIAYRDVTAELRAQEESAAERERLQAIVEQCAEGIIVTDAGGVVRMFNAAAQAQHGRPLQEVDPARWTDAYGLMSLAGEPLPYAATPLYRALRGGQVVADLWKVRRPDGAVRTLEGTAAPLRRSDGAIDGAVLITRDATERRAIEDELKLHSRILDSMAEGVCVNDTRGIIRYTNRAEDALFGWPRGALVGEHVRVLSAFSREEQRRVSAEIVDTVAARGEWSGEWPNRRKDGTRFITRARITSLDIGGAPHWVTVQEDITEAVRLAAELRASEDHYKATVELTPALRWTATPDGKVSGDQSRIAPELIHPDDLPAIGAAWRRSVATGEPYDVELRLRAPGSDEYRWMRGRAFPRRDDEGRIVRWYGTTEDVHDRKLAEARLRDSERWWRELVENLPALAWTALPDGHIEFYNRRWYEYTGTTWEQMQGWGWTAVHDPATLPQVLERWRASIASGEPFEMEFPLRGADGVFRWFLTRITPLRGAEGGIVRWFGTNTNVDEQRRQAAELREAVAARDTFISVASHELNTPLTTLLLRAQALGAALQVRPAAELAARIVRDVDSIRRQTVRLAALVSGMLDVSRIGAGRLVLHREAADLAELVREMVSTFVLEAQRAGVELRVDVPARLPGMWDPTRIGQIVANLLSNALRYGGGRPVDVSLRVEGDEAVLRVVDRGIGVGEVEQARIFEKYERAVSPRHYGGLGLGLFVTRELVQAMGGTIGLHSVVGEGSTFVVRLPVRADVAQ